MICRATDVARKLIILGREMGLELEMGDVKLESLVPPGLEQGSIDQFMAALPAHDAAMQQRFESARARGKSAISTTTSTTSSTAACSIRIWPTAADTG